MVDKTVQVVSFRNGACLPEIQAEVPIVTVPDSASRIESVSSCMVTLLRPDGRNYGGSTLGTWCMSSICYAACIFPPKYRGETN